MQTPNSNTFCYGSIARKNLGLAWPLCGMEVSVIAHNLSYSSNYTSTIWISHRILAQNEWVEVQFLHILALCFPNHSTVMLFELKADSNSFNAQ